MAVSLVKDAPRTMLLPEYKIQNGHVMRNSLGDFIVIDVDPWVDGITFHGTDVNLTGVTMSDRRPLGSLVRVVV